MKYFNF